MTVPSLVPVLYVNGERVPEELVAEEAVRLRSLPQFELNSGREGENAERRVCRGRQDGAIGFVSPERSASGEWIPAKMHAKPLVFHYGNHEIEARNAVDPDSGCLRNQRYILHDRDTKFCATFRSILESAGTKCLILPPHSPNLNAYSERWVRSAKEECLRKLILFGEGSLRRATTEYVSHFHAERNHQGKGNILLFPGANSTGVDSPVVQRNQRLGGLLSYYSRAA